MKIKRIKDFYTLDPIVYETFMKFINNNDINKSKFIEKLIKKYLDDNN